MIIQHNIMAINSHRQFNINGGNLSKNLEKLSSGYRINKAADDAAGLAISEKMRAQITGLNRAVLNSEDGKSLIQTAEGALQEVHSMLNRMVELATESANGTIQKDDREKIEAELTALKEEIDRISEATNFNGIKLLDGSLSGTPTIGAVDLGTGFATGEELGDSNVTIGKMDRVEDVLEDAVGKFNGQYYTGTEIEATYDDVAKTFTVSFENAAGDTISFVANTAELENAEEGDIVELDFRQTGDTAVSMAIELVVGEDGDVSAALDELETLFNNVEVTPPVVAPSQRVTPGDDVQDVEAATFAGETEDVPEMDLGIFAPTPGESQPGPVTIDPENGMPEIPVGTVDSVDITAVGAYAGDKGGATVGDITTSSSDLAALLKTADVGSSYTATYDAEENTITLSFEKDGQEVTYTAAAPDTALDGSSMALAFKDADNNTVATVTIESDDTETTGQSGTMGAIYTAVASAIGESTQNVVGAGLELDNTTGTTSVMGIDGLEDALAEAGPGATVSFEDDGTSITMTIKTAEDEVFATYTAENVDAALGDTDLNTITFTKDGEEPAGGLINPFAAPGTVEIDVQSGAASTTVEELAAALTDAYGSVTTIAGPDVPGEPTYGELMTGVDITNVNGLEEALVAGDTVSMGVNPDDADSIDLTITHADGSTTVYTADASALSGLTNGGPDVTLSFVDPDGGDPINITLTGNADLAAAPSVDDVADALNEVAELIDTGDGGGDNGGDNDIDVAGPGIGLTMQVGDTNYDYDKITVYVDDMSSHGLDIADIHMTTQENSAASLDKIKKAIEKVSVNRGNLGAMQNRLEHTINNLNVTSENMTAAESRIRDVDMAKEMMQFTKNNVLAQAAQAMLAQANQQPQQVLQLLR